MRLVLLRVLAGVALASVVVLLAAVGVPTAVAAAGRFALDSTAQSFDVAPAPVAKAAAEAAPRDEFGVTVFTLVQWPLAAGTPVSSFFGPRSCAGCSSFHSGIDFTPGAGVPIAAIADGVVVEAGSEGSWGVHVVVEHEVDGEVVRSGYAHMQSGSATVSVGDSVARGQILGRVGNTGQSEGAHLHFVIQLPDGQFVDPWPWMLAHVNVAG